MLKAYKKTAQEKYVGNFYEEYPRMFSNIFSELLTLTDKFGWKR